MLKKITYVVSFCYIFCWKMMFRMFTIKYEKYEMYENTRGDGRKNMLSDNIQLLRKLQFCNSVEQKDCLKMFPLIL